MSNLHTLPCQQWDHKFKRFLTETEHLSFNYHSFKLNKDNNYQQAFQGNIYKFDEIHIGFCKQFQIMICTVKSTLVCKMSCDDIFDT